MIRSSGASATCRASRGWARGTVEGPTLADRIAQGPIPVEALPIAKQIAEALEAAHELHYRG